jgi:hypothetical protein
MSDILTLNKPFVSQGFDTLTYTVLADGIYNVQVQAQVTKALATGAGAGTSADAGLGALGGSQGISSNNTTLGLGGKGLGFGGTPGQAYNTDGNGHGAGAGGGTLAEFSRGGGPLGDGDTGQGFGTPSSGYPQPPTDVHTPDSGAAVSSAVVMLVKKNGSTVFTAPNFTPSQSAMQFKYSAPFVATDVITVTFSSANQSDKSLNASQFTVSIGQGM